MIELTAKSVAQAALKAYNEGRLAFQNVDKLDPNRMSCRYVYDEAPGVCCAIGAALDPKSAAAVEGTRLAARVGGLIHDGLIQVPEADHHTLFHLQIDHDTIVGRAREGLDSAANISLFVKRLEMLAA